MNSGSEGVYQIAHVVRRFVMDEWGGTEAVVLNSCWRLQDRGNSVRILATAALSGRGPDQVEGIHVQRFPYFYPFAGLTAARRDQMDRKGGNPISFRLLRHLMRQPDLGLVHLHTMGRLGAQVRTACRIRGVPYVVSLHGGHFCVPPNEEQYFEELTKGCLDYGKPLGLLFGTRRILADAAAIICVGHDEYYAAKDRFLGKRVVYLPHGVDLKDLASGDGDQFRAANGLRGKKIILCVGRIDPQKNQLSLVQALRSILNRRPEAHLVLIGPVTVPSYLQKLQRESRDWGLEKHVHIIAGLHPSSQELRDAYAACDVFVLPSIHEPFGLVVLEAWACSKPVVVSPVASLQRVIRDGINGTRTKDASADEMGRAILKLLHHRSLAERLGKQGRETVEKHYSWDRIIDRLENLYEEMLKDRKGRNGADPSCK